MTYLHPTQTGRLTVLGGVALLTGIVGLIWLGNLDRRDAHLAPALNWLVILSFALFVVVCAAGLFGWIMREHEVWRHAGGPAESFSRANGQAKADRSAQVRPQYRDVDAFRYSDAPEAGEDKGRQG
ncbi:hypothetical protein [Catellatospora sichuanensis]|uniref:hypothetical protein n=1 Tax=Catellatospora sichuanensis TaxID=1969805 RepID=UPI001183E93E|nr:hypothetical protein [Catellatospora sichuanensis]